MKRLCNTDITKAHFKDATRGIVYQLSSRARYNRETTQTDFYKMVFSRPRLPILVAVVCVAAIPFYFIIRRTSLNGGYTEWSEWGSCSKECGEGIASRRRNCTNPTPGFIGKTCLELNLGPPIEEKKCKDKECPIDGGFGEWGTFGECNKPCGVDGVKKRVRACWNPQPRFGGKDCEGHAEETQACNLIPCPVDGGFSKWAAYGACDKTCGPGVKRRTRTCTNPPPAHGGKNCVGAVDEIQVCNDKPCPVDGGFADWGEFGACDKTCGDGLQVRNRACTNPAPANGGKNCEGLLLETRACNMVECPK